MKFVIDQLPCEDLWYLYLTDCTAIDDHDISKVIGLSFKTYQEILRDHGGIKIKNDNLQDVFFKDYDSAQRALEAVEPYLIMKELTK
jgi:hypothetical protein